MNGLGRAGAKGAATTAASQLIKLVIQVGSVAVLARLLLPSDYGLVAIMMSFVGLGQMVRDMGLFSAAVRAPELTVAQRDNLFWINVGVGLGLGVLCAASGPLLAAAFDHQSLTTIAIGLSPMFLLSGAAAQFHVSLVRDLRFGTVAAIELLGLIAGVSCAIVTALLGWGYWALVAQQLMGGLVGLIAFGLAARWLPGRFRRHTEIRPMLRLGGSLLFSGLLTYVSNNVDTMTVGYRFGPASVGLYNRSVQLVRSSLMQLEAPVGSVSLPIMSKLQHDDVKTIEFANRVQISVCYPIVLAVAVVTAVPADVVNVGLGSQWSAAAPLMAWIAIGTALINLPDAAGIILVSRGLAAPLARLSLITAGMVIAGVLIGSLFGLAAVAMGYSVAAAASWPISLYVLHRSTRLPVRSLMFGSLRIVAIGAVASLIARACTSAVNTGAVASILVASLTVAVVPVVACVVPSIRRDLLSLLGMVRLAFKR